MKPKVTPSRVDISLTQGLSQKFDPRHLPPGAATTAQNVVKKKRDALDKRLGFTPLNKAGQAGCVHDTGINLGSYDGRLVVAGSGLFDGQRFDTLSEYSDDTGDTHPLGLLPGMLAGPRQFVASVTSSAVECDSCVVGDFIVIVWTQWATAPVSLGVDLVLYYMIIEASTLRVVAAEGVIDNTTLLIRCPKVFAVNTSPATVVVTYGSMQGSGSIYARNITVALYHGATFGPAHTIATHIQSLDAVGNLCYEADAVAGDNAQFAVVWQDGDSHWAKVARVDATTLNVSASATMADGMLNDIINIEGFGLLADQTTLNEVAVAYSFMTNVDVGLGSATQNINMTALLWPSLGAINGFWAAATVYIADMVIPAEGATARIAMARLPAVSVDDIGIWWSPIAPVLNDTQVDVGGRICPQVQFLSVHNNTAPLSGGFVVDSAAMPRQTFSCVVASKPWVAADGTPHLLTWIPSATQGTYVLCAADYWSIPTAGTGLSGNASVWPLRACATIAPRQVLSTVRDNNGLFQYVLGNTSTLPKIQTCSTLPNGTIAVVALCTTSDQKMAPTLWFVQTRPTSVYESAESGRSLAISAGVPQFYDGSRTVEINFLHYPENLNKIGVIHSSGPNGPGLIWTNDADSYSWIATYEWTDARGQRHISARSAPLTITGQGITKGVHQQVTIAIPILGLTAKEPGLTAGIQSIFPRTAGVTIGLWRTQVNGTVFQRVNDPTGANGADEISNGLMFGSGPGPVRGTAYYIDKVSDSALASAPLLYGTGGDGTSDNADNFCPPSSGIMCLHKQRLFLADGNRVWYSKALTSGEGQAFNETDFSFVVGDTAPITALWSLDGRLIVGKRKSLYVVDGDGPFDNGQSNTFSDPQSIPTELGCSDWRSSDVTPEGIYFLSDSGLRLLTRGLSVQYAGFAVEDVVDQYPVLSGSALHPTENRMIMCANTDDTTSPRNGVVIVRDYALDAWTTIQVNDGTARGAVAAGVGLAARVAGQTPALHLLMADGTVWRENDPAAVAPYRDNGIYVGWTWESAWLKPQGPQGMARLWETLALLESQDPHGLRISFAFDYSDTYSLAYNYAWSDIQPGGVAQTPLTQVKPYVGQRFEAVRVKIEDVSDPSSVTGQGAKLLNLTMAIGTYEKPYRIPPSVQK